MSCSAKFLMALQTEILSIVSGYKSFSFGNLHVHIHYWCNPCAKFKLDNDFIYRGGPVGHTSNLTWGAQDHLLLTWKKNNNKKKKKKKKKKNTPMDIYSGSIIKLSNKNLDIKLKSLETWQKL